MRKVLSIEFVAVTSLVVSTLACGASAPTPTLYILPTGGAPTAGSQPPQDSPATAVLEGSAGEGDPIDLCALATPEEVAAVLGGPATRTFWYAEGQNCTLFLDETHLLIVQAGHVPDGKALHLRGLESVREKITDQAALQLLDQLDAQSESLPMQELVEQALPVWRAAGFTAEVEPGIAQWGFWYWRYEELGTLGQLGVGRASGVWLAVYITAPDQASAKALLRPLAATLLDRLPDNFTPTGNSH